MSVLGVRDELSVPHSCVSSWSVLDLPRSARKTAS